jgi:HK97 family phage portal protein
MIAGLVTPDADEDLTVDEAKTVKDTVTAAMTGVENAGAVAVINRKLKFTPWQLSAVDAQFMASRDFSIDEVGRWWGIPGHLLGQTEKQTSWGTGIAEQNRGLARWTLTPWTSRFEQRMTRLLAGRRVAEFDYSGFIAPVAGGRDPAPARAVERRAAHAERGPAGPQPAPGRGRRRPAHPRRRGEPQ